MRQTGIDIDYFTVTSIVRAIGVDIENAAFIFKIGYDSMVFVQNRLVFMYAICGGINDAKKLFSSIDENDLVSWNSLLSGCAHHGYGREVVQFFEQMRRTEIKPDSSTFLIVLSSCSHVRFIDKGLEYFYLMINNGLL